jgi:hypothetical protein
MLSGRAIAGIRSVKIRAKNWIAGLPTTSLGLRYPAKLTIEDEVIEIEKAKSVRNFVKFSLEAETIQCDYAMLKNFIGTYAVDGAVQAELITESQSGAADVRGLKGNEVFKFGSADAQPNSALGFGFKYNEEYSSGTKKTSCTIKGNLSIEKDVADAMLATVLTDSNTFGTDAKEYASVSTGNLVSINHSTPGNLLGKADIISYKLGVETKAGDATIYGREGIDYLSVSLEIVTSASSMANQRLLNAIEEDGAVEITTKAQAGSGASDDKKIFVAGTIGRVSKNEIGDKRSITITFKGEIPIRDITFVDQDNTIYFGEE